MTGDSPMIRLENIQTTNNVTFYTETARFQSLHRYPSAHLHNPTIKFYRCECLNSPAANNHFPQIDRALRHSVFCALRLAEPVNFARPYTSLHSLELNAVKHRKLNITIST